MSNFVEFSSDLSLSHLRLSDLRSHTTCYHWGNSWEEGRDNQGPVWLHCVVPAAAGTTQCNHTTSLRHQTTQLLQPQKLFTQDHVEGWQEKITLHLPVFVSVFFIYCVE